VVEKLSSVEKEKGLKERLQGLVQDALIEAKKVSLAVSKHAMLEFVMSES